MYKARVYNLNTDRIIKQSIYSKQFGFINNHKIYIDLDDNLNVDDEIIATNVDNFKLEGLIYVIKIKIKVYLFIV